ncbi:MAG: serine/threonine protein kinase [Roseiflexus sp.]|nr:serine/threonine protein kinase [Roseiflexus sp.]MCS7288886.1 serine/threonine protein kinase [Roseiflexus sp.]MDW8146850.1 serine/threonine-protein kinase [Roseiflexaceae bacterium]MDW8231818.1 serine/threonine-protein kinase [Roseiflexaceae bacterium]
MTPATIGRYRILGEIGRGGMAVVYRAYDPEADREVAIKVLLRELLHDPAFRARFHREVEAVAALEHPAIVPLYDSGEDAGQPFMVMRLMTGGSLADRLRRGPLPLAQAARIISHIAPALDAAHAAGLIHRDIKPDNVLFDHTDQPYLADFGIVSVMQTATILTRSGVIGTPEYMAPELTRPGGLSPLVDVYALGAMLFEMLTGRPPYRADTLIGALIAHVTEPIPDVRLLQPALPASIQRVLEQALAKDPQERYQSAGALAADLAAIAANDSLPTLQLSVPAVPVASIGTLGPNLAPNGTVVERTYPAPEPRFNWRSPPLFVSIVSAVVLLTILMFEFFMRSVSSEGEYPILLPTFTPFLGVATPALLPTATMPPPDGDSTFQVYKMASVAVAEPGMEFSYFIGVSTWINEVQQVALTDVISPDLEVVAVIASPGSVCGVEAGSVVRCPLMISPSTPALIQVNVRVRDTVTPGTVITNIAEGNGVGSEVVTIIIEERSPFRSPTPLSLQMPIDTPGPVLIYDSTLPWPLSLTPIEISPTPTPVDPTPQPTLTPGPMPVYDSTLPWPRPLTPIMVFPTPTPVFPGLPILPPEPGLSPMLMVPSTLMPTLSPTPTPFTGTKP